MVAYAVPEMRGSVRQKQTEGKILRPICFRDVFATYTLHRNICALRTRRAPPRGRASTESESVRVRSIRWDRPDRRPSSAAQRL